MLPSFVIILSGERERAGCLIVFLMSCGCFVLCLFLTVPWVGLKCMIAAFPGHIPLLSENIIVTNMFVAQYRADTPSDWPRGQNF